MPNMPSNDDLKQKIDVMLQDETSTVAYKLHDQSHANPRASIEDTNDIMHQEFTFFQKNKRSSRKVKMMEVSQPGNKRLADFIAKLDEIVARNEKNKRHMAELMQLMSEVAQELSPVGGSPTRQVSRRSKWLFYSCLALFGLGWFSLFPFGQNVFSYVVDFLK